MLMQIANDKSVDVFMQMGNYALYLEVVKRVDLILPKATMSFDAAGNPDGSTGSNIDTPVDVEAEAKAALKGSVGGVQGILEIQKSVSAGITEYTAALAILDLIYGIGEADAKRILGNPKPVKDANPTIA